MVITIDVANFVIMKTLVY